ncbi:amidohydrolase family protein [Bosea sp. (in: a-proteobacteria)]|jgi:cytosine deaminase|uniref:amidohydrolase family protein n=1 Tax=Bosea sp. (in: a-proteobacteria) TaxID=1871050 RepID=UPI002DDD811A|nr:amidohydrolase family protein [Bosea sp. (in: a-proteobacteria)]HEV2510848.1 amidohydrolase family protein [Bosea sp. (in: a-proteobacteria)]
MLAAPSLDLVIRRATVRGHDQPQDIGVRAGRIAAIGAGLRCDAPEIEVGGRLALPGFVDSHIHLDKACLLGRCGHCDGGLAGAIASVAAMKRDFTAADVYERGARVIEMAIGKGTTRMRTHVEVDPRAGLRSFAAIKALKADYAWGLDLSICVFPQEGLTNDPGTEELLVSALENGADLLGGCPYTDTDPAAQIERLFALARRFDVDLDFHLDFDLDPSWMHLDEVCRQTQLHGWGGRVAIGHVTKLSMVPPDALAIIGRKLVDTGIALTVLPATDLYLMGRQETHARPRGLTPAHLLAAQGVTCSVATNNVLNPFTPFGDGSLLRLANLYANVAQCGPHEFEQCLDLVTLSPARLMRLDDYGIAVGNPADLAILDAGTPGAALAEISEPVMGFKRGRLSFERPPAKLNMPVAGKPARPMG